MDLPKLWFDQKVNHKACSDKTFKQCYFMNHQYYKKGGPAFLFIGREGELSSKWAQLSILNKAAEKHGGVVFALEHRYYGKL
ncbi:Thymus-specific serine protease [Entomophthora muscae]|uniref:Thymus-specific serine protease n=1 Tax=Entomophthora muscae TaxID=34485 RepID=A0ACC2UDX6_9FUNG|nr:Thymus-specific serine protease [Entomophthora muscae]